MTTTDDATNTMIELDDFSASVRDIFPSEATGSISDSKNNEMITIPKKHYFARGFRSIVLSESVKTLQESAFARCKQMESITLPDKLTFIGDHCFQNCSSLKTIIIPDSVSYIGKEAFLRCTNLRHVDLPKNLRFVSSSMFRYCRKLRYIDIPKSVDKIYPFAFSDCVELIGISLPDTITKIPRACFQYCKNLQYFEFSVSDRINDPYITIEEDAFYDCVKLVKVDLSRSSAYSIGDGCFRFCTNLESVILSKKTRLIHRAAFENCHSLQYIGYDNVPFHEYNGKRLFGIDLQYVEDFDDDAFAYCRKIQFVKVYENQRLGVYLFDSCINLEYISIPGNIRQNPLFDGENIKEVMICSKIQHISYTAAFEILYGLVCCHPILVDQPCTIEQLYPIEVLYGVLYVDNRPYKDKPSNHEIVNMFYILLRMSPSTLEHLINEERITHG